MLPAVTERSPLSWPWIGAWALLGVVLACWLHLVPYQGIPHVQDEVVYQLQARILSEGRLWEEARLPRAAFVYDFVWNEAPSQAFPDGRRFGIFPNGWPLVLALGTLVGLPWLVAPLLHGLTVLVGALVGGRCGGARTAWLAAPLLALSPGLLLQAQSRLSHTLCALLTIAALALAERAPSRPVASALGGVLALLLLTRPVDALAVGGVLGLWVLLRARSDLRALLSWWPTVLGVGLGVALFLAQNKLYTGSATVFPQDAWFARGEPPFPSPGFRYEPGCNALGFGDQHGCAPSLGSLGHSPAKAWFGIEHNAALGLRLWLGSLPVAFLGAAAVLDRGGRRLLGLTLGIWAALAGGYALYWYVGTCLGPRFHHAVAPVLILAVAHGLARLSARLRLPAAAGLLLLPLMLLRLSRALPELPGYWGVDDRLEALEASWKHGPALILVAYGEPYRLRLALPETIGDQLTYSAIQRRGAWLERRGGELVYAELQPQLVEATRARWPELPTYVLVMRGDPDQDEILPLSALGVLPEQVQELALPVEPVAWD